MMYYKILKGSFTAAIYKGASPAWTNEFNFNLRGRPVYIFGTSLQFNTTIRDWFVDESYIYWSQLIICCNTVMVMLPTNYIYTAQLVILGFFVAEDAILESEDGILWNPINIKNLQVIKD